jgi:hypothetical protein
MSGLTNTVSLNRIIGNVIGNLGLKNTNNVKDEFSRWACEAVSKIGSTSSYVHHECELTIRNRKATLPPNFVYLEAMKYGQKIVNVTERSFRLFNKGIKNPSFEVETNFIGGQKVTDIPGVPLVISVLLGGSYMTGDLIAVTITSNNCGAIYSNTFNYLVQPAQSLTDIALEINNQINAIGNIGYSSTPSNDSFIVTGDSPEVSFQISLFTDSGTGTLSQTITQKRVPPKKNTVNTNNSNVAKLNTGISSNSSSGGNGTNYNYNFDVNTGDQVFSIDNGCINFNVYDDEKIGISYMGVALDKEGWPLISEVHEDAVTHYLMYMHKSIDYYNGKLAQHVHDKLERRWYWLCGQARGDDELPNQEELKYLTNMWMQLIPLPSPENF